MKIGLVLPTFLPRADDALELAARAEAVGLDGVFAFDHLWPMGSPERPALAPFPVLAAIAARSATLSIGTLVARVGLVGTAHLVAQFATLDALAPGRVIAALGTGDRLSDDEQRAYGLAVLSGDERRALLGEALVALAPRPNVWCGAGSRATNDLARRHGAEINVWGVPVETVRQVGASGAVSWAGRLDEDVAARLDQLAAAGATWAIALAPLRLEQLAEWRAAH